MASICGKRKFDQVDESVDNVVEALEREAKRHKQNEHELLEKPDLKNPNLLIQKVSELTKIVSYENRSRVMESYLVKYGACRHQIESYNHFVDYFLPAIIMENPTQIIDVPSQNIRVVLDIHGWSIKKPTFRETSGHTRDIYPFECRVRGITYALTATMNMDCYIYNTELQTPRLISKETCLELPVCQIPVALRSKYCHLSTSTLLNNENPFEEGGYFIVNGSKKDVIGQEAMKTNFPFIYPSKYKNYAYELEIRSRYKTKMRTTSTMKMFITDIKNGYLPEIVVNLPFVKYDVDLIIVFNLLGINDSQEIMKLILCADDLDRAKVNQNALFTVVQSLIDSDVYQKDISAIKKVLSKAGIVNKNINPSGESKKKDINIDHVMRNEFLPHIGLNDSSDTLQSKAIHFGILVKNLIHVALGLEPISDRDHYENKRINANGPMLAFLMRTPYRNALKKMTMTIKNRIEEGKPIELATLMDHKRITSCIRFAMATGSWGPSKGASTLTGVAQVSNTMNRIARMSTMKKVACSYNKDLKIAKPRLLHTSHWMILCPTETPEGAQCGLIKNLTLLSHLRIGCDHDEAIKVVLYSHPSIVSLEKSTGEMRENHTSLFVNGTLVGFTSLADETVSSLREYRRCEAIPFDSSIYFCRKKNTIFVETDWGCCTRPCFNLKKIHLLPSMIQNIHKLELFDVLVRNGIIEYVDKMEEHEYRIACLSQDLWNEKEYTTLQHYTHLEIHPVGMFGICASLIPHSEFNQSPRNTYQSAMQKQAMGTAPLNHAYLWETAAYMLQYGQTPLVKTSIENMFFIHFTPYGYNAMIAIMCFMGYNQEDGLIAKQSAIDMGLFRSFTFRTYKDDEKTKGNEINVFKKPDPKECRGTKNTDYSKLNEDGFPDPGCIIPPNGVIIGKTTNTMEIESQSNFIVSNTMDPNQQTKDKKKIKTESAQIVSKNMESDNSVLNKNRTSCEVFQTIKTNNKNGNLSAKVNTFYQNIPEVGDKLSSRHGQKSTIGIIIPEEDMPFDEMGHTPDAIMNPHAFPSRMTIGQLVEMIHAKVGAIKGEIQDGTAFNGTSIEDLCQFLAKHGYNRFGTHRFYHGCTGMPVETPIFYAPCYYQRLRHMSEAKIHARSTGPRNIITHQPVGGKAKHGGGRIGYMELNCLISLGVGDVILERLFLNSDFGRFPVCENCGFLAQDAPKEKKKKTIVDPKPYCKYCDSHEFVREVFMPQSFKLIIQEFMAIGIALRLKLKKKATAPTDFQADYYFGYDEFLGRSNE